MIHKKIDGGKAFDWGRTSADYARWRDIYPAKFYEKILELGMYKKGQHVLDIGTGTGVLPRNLYKYGAKITGVDASENQIKEARRLSEGMDIDYVCCRAEEIELSGFDVVSACQCFHYFDHNTLAPKIAGMLNSGGLLGVMFMEWLPFDDKVAKASEELVLKYNPYWSGGGFKRKPLPIPEPYKQYFDVESREEFDVSVPFTRESWNGRMKSCRGIGASLSDVEIEKFEKEHLKMLSDIADEEFKVLHFVSIVTLRKK